MYDRGPTRMNPSTYPSCCFHHLCTGSCLSSRGIVVLAGYKYMCVYIKKNLVNWKKIHLVFHLLCFRFISAAIICLSVLSFSLYLTPYFSVKYKEKELFSTILSYYILSKLYGGNFPWAACQQSGCHNSFDLWYNNFFLNEKWARFSYCWNSCLSSKVG